MTYSPSQPRNIVVTGFMATGKTAVGRVLADQLGWKWVDTDAALEARHGPITDIFIEQGETAFRDLERLLVADLAQNEGTVISAGGGMMIDPANVRLLAPDNRIFCLVATVQEIMARVTADGSAERPLLLGADLTTRVEELLTARRSAYRRFACVSASQPVEDVASEIRLLLDLPAARIERRGAHGDSPQIQVGIGLLPFVGGSAPLVVSDQPVADLHGPLFGPGAQITTIKDAHQTVPTTEATTIVGLGGLTVHAAIDELQDAAPGLTIVRAPTSPGAIAASVASTQPVVVDLVTLQTLPEDRRGPWGLSLPSTPGTLSAVQRRIAAALSGA